MQAAALGGDDLAAFSAEQIISLNSSAILGLSTGTLAALTASQAAAFTPGQVAAMTSAQVAALNSSKSANSSVQDIASLLSAAGPEAAAQDNTSESDGQVDASAGTQASPDVTATILSYLDV